LGWETAVAQSTPTLTLPLEGEWNESTAHYWLFDLGRAYPCPGVVEIDGAEGGERLAISYADKIVDGELVISDPTTYCRVRLTDFFELRPGRQTVESFALRGGRYLLSQLVGTNNDVHLRFQVR
jgi:hypothetical protein